MVTLQRQIKLIFIKGTPYEYVCTSAMVRRPPSNVVPLPPRRGKLLWAMLDCLVTDVPPLSLMTTVMVSSQNERAASASVTRLMEESTTLIIAPTIARVGCFGYNGRNSATSLSGAWNGE